MSPPDSSTNHCPECYSEATWGADPLEYLGGFGALQHDVEATYPSSLAADGTVSWSSQLSENSARHSKQATAALEVGFPNVDWQFLQSVYGWAALQYQAWARGSLTVGGDVPQTLLVYTDKLLEFLVDDKPYFGGDFYAYRSAPLVLMLEPGDHKLEIRLIRDVRLMGGIGEPTIAVKLHVALTQGGLAVVAHRLIVSDVINGCLINPLASVPVRNEGQYYISIISVSSHAVCSGLPLSCSGD